MQTLKFFTLALLALLLVSCNSTTNRASKVSLSDTTMIMHRIDKMVDSLKKLSNLIEVSIAKDNEFETDIFDVYYFNIKKDPVIVHIQNYDSGTKYYFIDKKPIYSYEENEAGTSEHYYNNGKSFCVINHYSERKMSSGDNQPYTFNDFEFSTFQKALSKLK